MPLGKLSRKQLQQAYVTLNELNSLIDSSNEKRIKDQVITTTNKFYTLIPHDFGMKTPQLIDSSEILKVRNSFIVNYLNKIGIKIVFVFFSLRQS